MTSDQNVQVESAIGKEDGLLAGGPVGEIKVSTQMYGRINRRNQTIVPVVSLIGAPTGKAAQRLSQVAGGEATTIHTALETDKLSSAAVQMFGRIDRVNTPAMPTGVQDNDDEPVAPKL